MPWFRDRETLAFIGLRYLPRLAALDVVWEALQIPLYTIWTEAPAGYVAYAILHCTAGDVLIGASCLALALIATRAGPVARWRWGRVAALTVILGVAYTIVSEWLNTALLRWSYSELMPLLGVAGARIGVAPLLQWIIVPPLALYLAGRRTCPNTN